MSSALDVVGQILVEFDHRDVRVEFRHDTIDVELPDLRAGLALRRQFSGPQRRERLKALQRTLGHASLTVQIWVGRDAIGKLSADSVPGWTERLLRVDPIELNTKALARHLFGRQSRATPTAGNGSTNE